MFIIRKVKWYNPNKGYGFITEDKTEKDIFLHVSALEDSKLRVLKEDQKIEFDIKEEKYKEIPAVTHVNGTGRLQSVDKNISPRYHKLISKFAEKSGVPILLNTSFNENEPIVNKPEEALDCFLRTKMDMLVMGNVIVER